MSIHTPMKTIKEEDSMEGSSDAFRGHRKTEKASFKITKCISFQKFRYSGEARPGKKYQEKDFITLKFSNLKDKVVRVIIMCINADDVEHIHPNGLVGASCHDGIYDKLYAITKEVFKIEIPYIRIERIKIKKNAMDQIAEIMERRVSNLPSPYRERCHSQFSKWELSSCLKFDTAKVRLAVFVTLENDTGHVNGTLHAASNVICNGSEKTQLGIYKLSSDSVSALTGGCIDIFTAENGPDIEPDSYFLQVSFESDVNEINWKSEQYSPKQKDVLYKRVITYEVPPFEPDPGLIYPVTATLHLKCPTSNLCCTKTFEYVPQPGIQTFAGTFDSQGDIQNDDGLMQGTTSCRNAITTSKNDEYEQPPFQPFNLQNFRTVKMEESVLQLENQNTNVVPEDSSSAFFICTSDGSNMTQIDDSKVGPVYVPTLEDKKQMIWIYPSSQGRDEESKIICSEGSCEAPTLDNNPEEMTHAVIAKEKSHNIIRKIQNVDEQLQELTSSVDNRIQNADNRNNFKYISLDVNNAGNSVLREHPSARVYDSESISSLTMMPLTQKSPNVRKITSPWQVDEIANSAAVSNHDVKRFKTT